VVLVKEYEVKEGLYYSEHHVWVKVEDSLVRIGITDYAQKSLKEIVSVLLPEVGEEIRAGEPMGSVESIKAVSDVIAPISGVVKEVNEEVLEDPSIVNEDPYGRGWLVVAEPKSLEEDLAKLMDFEKAVEWHKTLE